MRFQQLSDEAPALTGAGRALRCPLLATCFVSVFVAGCQEKTFFEAVEPPAVSRTSIGKLTCLEPARLPPPWRVAPDAERPTSQTTLRFRAQPKDLGSTWSGDPADPDQGFVTLVLFNPSAGAISRALPAEQIADHIARGRYKPLEVAWDAPSEETPLEAYTLGGTTYYYTPDRKVQCRELARAEREIFPNPLIECQIDTALGVRARMMLSSYNRASLPIIIAHAIDAVGAVADCSKP